MTFTVANNEWEAPENWLPSRHISVEKNAALNQMIDDCHHERLLGPRVIWYANQTTGGDLL